MDKKKLREIIAVFKESGLAKMEISETTGEENYSIRLENATAPAMPAAVQYVQTLPESKPQEEETAQIKDYNKYRDIKSPMVGIFYTAHRSPAKRLPPLWWAYSILPRPRTRILS